MPVVNIAECDRAVHEGHVFWVLQQGTTRGLNVGCVVVDEAHDVDQHPEEQIYIIRSGRGIVTIGEERHEVGRDMVVYIPPNQPHQVTPLPGAERLSYIFVTRMEAEV